MNHNNKNKKNKDMGPSTTCPAVMTFSHEAYKKMMAYVNNVEGEVSGIGAVVYDSDPCEFIVEDIFLIEQTISAGSTSMSEDGIAKFFQERLKAKKKDDLSKYKLWWHSHYNFGVFWSGTDDTTIEDFDQEKKENNWFLSVVVNQREKILARLDLFEPFRMTYNGVPIYIEDKEPDVDNKILAEIDKKVSISYVTGTRGNGSTVIQELPPKGKNPDDLYPPYQDDPDFYINNEWDYDAKKYVLKSGKKKKKGRGFHGRRNR